MPDLAPPDVSGDPASTALLYSGGLDSAILLHHLAQKGLVWPIYVDSGLAWQEAERAAAIEFARSLASDTVKPLVTLRMPVGDLYGDHWSVTGRGVPGCTSPDEAVYLPGRNALLAIKPLVWCAMNGVPTLALATLASNPFPDATTRFFDLFSAAISEALGCHLTITRPFGDRSKEEVMRLGSGAPLATSFSCIAASLGREGTPLHCGRCNKCAERRRAFASAGMVDPTTYAA